MIINNAIAEEEYIVKKDKVIIDFSASVFSLAMAVLALIVIAWFNNGIFPFFFPYIPNYIRYGIYSVWLGLSLTSNKRYLSALVLQIWPLLLFFIYMIFISFFIEVNLKVYIKSIAYLIMLYSIFLYYIDGKYRKIQKLLCGYIIVDYIIVGINTFLQLRNNPMIARYLSTGIETREILLGDALYPGVASYGYFYALVSIILLLGFIFLNYRKRSLLAIIAVVPAIALLIKGAFTMAIMFTLIFLILIIILKYTNQYTFILITLLGIISLLIFQGFFATILSRCAEIDWIPNPVSVRLNELAYFFFGHDISGTDFYYRIVFCLRSLEAFIHNFLAGTVINPTSIYSLGGHSAWLDLLATFGLFSIPFFIFLYKAYKYGKKRIPMNLRSFYNVYWLYFISLGLVNTLLFAPIYTIWFLFLPLYIKNYLKKKGTLS